MLQAHHDGVVDVTIRPEIAGESAWSAEITAPDGEVIIIPETTAAEQVVRVKIRSCGGRTGWANSRCTA